MNGFSFNFLKVLPNQGRGVKRAGEDEKGYL
jgi:hypothetical protein